MCVVPSYLQRFATDNRHYLSLEMPIIYNTTILLLSISKPNFRFIVKTNSYILSRIIKYAIQQNKIKQKNLLKRIVVGF